MFIDEFSQIQEDTEVRHRTSDTAGCRLFNGTHMGTTTEFYKMSKMPEIRKFVMHWTRHPYKREGLYRYDEKSNRIQVLDKSYVYPDDARFVHSSAPAGGPCPGIRSPWYDDQCVRKGHPTAVAMDLDIDAGGSVAQFFDAITIRELVAEYSMSPTGEATSATTEKQRDPPTLSGTPKESYSCGQSRSEQQESIYRRQRMLRAQICLLEEEIRRLYS
jgi:hypothetical protein